MLAATDDFACDWPARGLFAESKKKIRQFGFFQRGKELGCGIALRRVEPHVERTGGLKAETPLRIGQLIRRKPQIEQNPVDLLDAKLVQDFGQLRITGLPQGAARVGEVSRRPSDHQWIAIESDEFSVRTKLFEEDAAMTAGSEGRVHHRQSRREFEDLNDFPYQDRTVDGRTRVTRGPHRIGHCVGLENEWG